MIIFFQKRGIVNLDKYAISFYKLPGSYKYRIKVQNTYTYKYVEDIEVHDKGIDETMKVVNKLREKYVPSYVCEVYY